MTKASNAQLIQLAIAEVPNIAAVLRALFAKANPSAPVLTDDEIFAAYKAAFDSGIAKDDEWLAQHPGPGYSKKAATKVAAGRTPTRLAWPSHRERA